LIGLPHRIKPAIKQGQQLEWPVEIPMQEEAAAEAVATMAMAVAEAKVNPKAIEDIPSLPPPEEPVLTWATMSLTMDPREQQIKWPQPGSK
jgi:hypothetical protein